MGGTDDPTNLIEVTVEEHAELHLSLYLEHGRPEDWLAYRGLSGTIGKEQIVREKLSLASKKNIGKHYITEEGKRKIAENNRRRKRRPRTEESKQKTRDSVNEYLRKKNINNKK
jgi:hypothetical protein